MKYVFSSRGLSVCFVVSFFLSQSICAQKVNVNFDYATFRYDSLRTYAELYYSFSGRSLHFVQIAVKDSEGTSSFVDTLLFNVSIRNANNDSFVTRQVWDVPVRIPDTTQPFLSKSLVGKTDFVLFPGKYKLGAKCEEIGDSLNNDSLTTDFPVPAYSGDKLESSEIELCSTITQGGGSGTFYKNTYNVVPNPSAIYGVGMPIIYYYLEVYNIHLAAGDSVFTAGYEVRDSFGQIRKSSYRTRKKFGSSSVEVGTVNGSDLKTGTYTLTYTVVDSAANLYCSSSRRLFVYNPSLGKPEMPDTNITSGAVLSSVYVTMGEPQLDKEFAEARYTSTSSERSRYGELSGVASKRQFLYEFWRKRNPDQASKVNDMRAQYLERVAYADDHFRAGSREGWQTDRGRVYIVYGNPDEIDRHPNETDSKPYEIWYYNSLEGGVSFDFVDRTGFGDYMLVNSTERNEIHDSNWQGYLTQ